MKKVYISILNYNRSKFTISCLSSLDKVEKNGIDLKVLVIDNASKEKLKLPEFKNINPVLIENQENLGFSGGHNVGMKIFIKEKGDYFLTLNNDTILEKNFLKELISAAENKGEGIFGPKIYFAKGHEFHKNRYEKDELGKVIWYAGGVIDWKNILTSHRGVDEVDEGQYDGLEETDFASGCCFLVSLEILEKVGIFDERYFLYLEDGDLNERAKRAGFKIYFVPASRIWHYNASTTGGPGSEVHDYFLTRNRLLFGMKYGSLRAKNAILRESLRIIVSGRKWQKIGVRDFFLRKFGKGSFSL